MNLGLRERMISKAKWIWGAFCIILSGMMILSCLAGWDIHASAATRLMPDDGELVIVIDPGHGGENLGTIENGFLEKEMTLLTAQAMYEELCKFDDVTVYLTRDTDQDMTLKERAEYAENMDADFLFSIHYNASADHRSFGSEVWIPSQAPYYAYAYQFAQVQLTEMQNMGLFIRGIKTRVEKDDWEYYGIIRENLIKAIPAVIIEHCHVDNEADSVYCDSDAELIAFGKADAAAVAKYFGLKSKELGVDYSGDAIQLAEVLQDSKFDKTMNTDTPPDVCQIEIKDINEETGELEVLVTAADYDSILLYYDYSIDDGETYYSTRAWPDSDFLSGTYPDVMTAQITIPPGIKPKIKFRVYNVFDQTTESNTVELLNMFYYDVASDKMVENKEGTADADGQDEIIGEQAANSPKTVTFRPEDAEIFLTKTKADFIEFVKIGLIVAMLIISTMLSVQVISYTRKHRRRRRR